MIVHAAKNASEKIPTVELNNIISCRNFSLSYAVIPSFLVSVLFIDRYFIFKLTVYQ